MLDVGTVLAPTPDMAKVVCHGIKTKLALLAALAVAYPADDAFACTPPPAAGWWHGGTAQGGPGTAIVAQFSCTNCASGPEFEWAVTDPDGNKVDGAVLQYEFSESSGFVAWKPDTALSPGKEYHVELSSSSNNFAGVGRSGYRVSSTAPDTAPAQPKSFLAAGYLESEGETVCCGEGHACGAANSACFIWPDKMTRRVTVSLLWFDSDEYRSQFLVEATLSTAKEQRVFEPHLGAQVSAELAPADEGGEYCYEATARHLFTGKTTSISGCIPASDVESFDGTDNVAIQRNYILTSCNEPPLGHEDEWCEVHGTCAKEGCSLQPGSSQVPRLSLVGIALVVAGLVRRTRFSAR
jgi:hypothetical protein